MGDKQTTLTPGTPEWAAEAERALSKARSRTLMAAKHLSRLMAEFDGELKYCEEALTEVLDAADQLEAIEQAMEVVGE